MNIEFLVKTPSVSIFYDSLNRWLYLDWCGDLTLNSVQESCLVITQCFLARDCARILNDNTDVTSVTPDVGIWLANTYLPHMQLAGVEYMAWVHSAGTGAQYCTDTALHDLSSPVVALFDDLASAYSWLRTVKFKLPVVLSSPAKKAYRHQQGPKGHASALSMLYSH